MLYRVLISNGTVLDTLYVEASSIPAACTQAAPRLEDFTDTARISSVKEIADEVVRARPASPRKHKGAKHD